MKKILATLLLCFSLQATAGVIASMPNQAGGKIVLTDEDCIHNGKNYKQLFKSYFYTTTGLTGDGCWKLEDEAIVIVWLDSGSTKRYPVTAFDLRVK
jgi:hypothetical protein